jgi:hypothetical protein
MAQQSFLHRQAEKLSWTWEKISKVHTCGYIPIHFESLMRIKERYKQDFEHVYNFDKRCVEFMNSTVALFVRYELLFFPTLYLCSPVKKEVVDRVKANLAKHHDPNHFYPMVMEFVVKGSSSCSFLSRHYVALADKKGNPLPFEEQKKTLTQMLKKYNSYDVNQRKSFMYSCLRQGWIKSLPNGTHRTQAAGTLYEQDPSAYKEYVFFIVFLPFHCFSSGISSTARLSWTSERTSTSVRMKLLSKSRTTWCVLSLCAKRSHTRFVYLSVFPRSGSPGLPAHTLERMDPIVRSALLQAARRPSHRREQDYFRVTHAA